VSVGDLGALNNTYASSVLADVYFSSGALNFTGSSAQTLNRSVWMNSASNIITANGAGALTVGNAANGANAVVNGTGARNLVLGGASAAANTIAGIVTNGTAANGVTKFDSGTWVIASPGTTSTSVGTAGSSLAVKAIGTTATQTITVDGTVTTSTSGLVVGQPVTGVGIPFGTFISQIISTTQFSISQNITASTAAQSLRIGTVVGSTSALSTVSVSAGTAAAPTLTVAYVPASIVVGQPVTHTSLPASQGWFVNSLATSTTAQQATTNAVSTGTTNPVLTFATLPVGLAVGQPVTSTNLPSSGAWYISAITATQLTLASANGSSITAGKVVSGEVISPVSLVLTLGNTTGSSMTVGAIAASQSVTPGVSPSFAGPLTVTGGDDRYRAFLGHGQHA
jgi:hypothetical protein